MTEIDQVRARAAKLEDSLRQIATVKDRSLDTGHSDWSLGWVEGYNAALADMRLAAGSALADRDGGMSDEG